MSDLDLNLGGGDYFTLGLLLEATKIIIRRCCFLVLVLVLVIVKSSSCFDW